MDVVSGRIRVTYLSFRVTDAKQKLVFLLCILYKTMKDVNDTYDQVKT